ncbi:glycosyltransferase family 2 protein [Williamsia herbipolensis]|uniref:glycosyltransferase family 2 protein n=1 Tax=Williamsia herbipolensis TaxID=1603258 RepID=UPI0005F7FA00|nr:glycosyltransferase family 2 protein [Williamsia herbipolensis]
MAISVVIPALDEERTIAHCIGCVLDQGPAVGEIIVVDNNSTDATAQIVTEMARDHPAIRLLAEPVPGLSHARYAGFNAATGDVIAGIDADTRVSPGWADAIETMFARHPEVGAGTGPAVIYDLPHQGWYRKRARDHDDRAARASVDGAPVSIVQVSGANTALRTAAWDTVKDAVSYRRDVYEDLDLSLNLKAAGWVVALVPGMAAGVSGRRLLSGPRDFLRYALCIPRTYRLHGKRGLARLTTVIVVAQAVLNTARLPITRAWDPSTESFSLRRLRSAGDDVREPPVSSGFE